MAQGSNMTTCKWQKITGVGDEWQDRSYWTGTKFTAEVSE